MNGVVNRKAPSRGLAEAVVAALPDGMVVLDGGGTIVAINEAWRRLARDNGAPGLAEGGVGANYLAVCHAASGTSAEGADAVYAGLRAVLDGTQPSFTMDYPCPTPTGRRWFLLRATPLPGERGAVVQHIDITARKQAEDERDHLRALAEAAQREATHQARQFEAVFAAIQDGVIVFDRDGHVIRANAADRNLLGEGAMAPAGELIQERAGRLGALLAQYAYRAERRGTRLRAVAPHPHLSRTVYASPQLGLWERDDEQWRKVLERPPRRRRLDPAPEASAQQLVLPIAGLVIWLIATGLG